MTDLRDKIIEILQYNLGFGPVEEMADAVLDTVGAQHAADIEAVRGACAMACDKRGVEEQESYGLNRGTQNFFRARDIIRALDLSQITGTTPHVPKADLDAAQEEIARLREALEFYADRDYSGYDVEITDYGMSLNVGEIIKDAGDKARAALAKTGGKT